MNLVILRKKGLGNTSTKSIASFSEKGFKVIRNDQPLPSKIDVLLRWGCTSQASGAVTINKAAAIQEVANKFKSRKKMIDNGVSCPQLFMDEIKFPCIVRNYYHAQGKKLFHCKNAQEFAQAQKKLGANIYVSEYIEKDVEFGVFIFNKRVWSVVSKTAKTEAAKKDIAWNVAQGGHKFDNVNWDNWPMAVVEEALKAMEVFPNLDFGRVDVMVKDGKPYVLEINSAHSLTSEYRQKSFAKVLDWHVTNKGVKNPIKYGGSYKAIIHPALRENLKGFNL